MLIRYTSEREAPSLDAQSNIFDTSAELVGTGNNAEVLRIHFSREIVTTDEDGDVPLNTPRFWIWAIGRYLDGVFIQHDVRDRTPQQIVLAQDCPGTPACYGMGSSAHP